MVQQPLVGQGLLSIEASRSHPVRHTTLGRTPLDEWPARRRDLYLPTQHSQETDIQAAGGIRTHNPSKPAAADPRLRPRGHWDRAINNYTMDKVKKKDIMWVVFSSLLTNYNVQSPSL